MSDNKDVILYMHAGSDNHGCEAIANTVISMLSNSRTKDNIYLLTYRKELDEKYSLNNRCVFVTEKSFDNHKIAHVLYVLYRAITKDVNSLMRFRYSEILKKNAPIAISIGGDNYCYDSMLNDLRLSNSVFNEKGMKTILLGCSIEPDLVKREDIKKDLSQYHTIIARESITYNALKEVFGETSEDSASSEGTSSTNASSTNTLSTNASSANASSTSGVSNNSNTGKLPNIYLFPDPAFTLKPRKVSLPEGFIPQNTVGINISPQILSSAASEIVTLDAYTGLIDYIINNTDMNIALVPHVVWTKNDDRIPLKKLYDYCVEKGYKDRVIQIEDNDAEALKGYISQCRFFVGARTHSTIAAYSTCVPTLVVGYSVKAIGIATDLFNGYNIDDLVLQVQKLTDKNQLTNSFKWLEEHETELRTHLKNTIPGYSIKALEIGKTINSIC